MPSACAPATSVRRRSPTWAPSAGLVDAESVEGVAEDRRVGLVRADLVGERPVVEELEQAVAVEVARAASVDGVSPTSQMMPMRTPAVLQRRRGSSAMLSVGSGSCSGDGSVSTSTSASCTSVGGSSGRARSSTSLDRRRARRNCGSPSSAAGTSASVATKRLRRHALARGRALRPRAARARRRPADLVPGCPRGSSVFQKSKVTADRRRTHVSACGRQTPSTTAALGDGGGHGARHGVSNTDGTMKSGRSSSAGHRRGDGVGRRHLHVLGDGRGAGVERTAEDAGKGAARC